ncbi:outer membrane protein [Biformimicrobium ophioploci]|uniref:Outer membrane protein beta-barrel domain-containing protein n=1 Tax=Biformimicrobium ophioploci TaxID=3036711 RepID=A0ABQ6M0F3_9GAMM|nr:outer membrane beta-barrel protein [Microbulbifer sp. NKW57]GMG87755.1 hypothetical protein MNKW57_20760 [Microbulbifer sp. NKW57]
MKRTIAFCAALSALASGNVLADWNNPLDGFCRGEYFLTTRVGGGVGEIDGGWGQSFDDAFISFGVQEAWSGFEVAFKYLTADGDFGDLDQYSVDFNFDLAPDCDIMCLYLKMGWNYGDFDLDRVRLSALPDDFEVTDEEIGQRYVDLLGESENDDWFSWGIGFQYKWTDRLITAIEYNHHNVGRVGDYTMDKMENIQLSLTWRFGKTWNTAPPYTEYDSGRPIDFPYSK